MAPSRMDLPEPITNGLQEYQIKQQPIYTPRRLRIIVIGAGASGIYMAIRQEQLLKDVDFLIYEKNTDVGGTWYENKYPGAACDVPSHNYTFSFAGKTDWSQYYAGSDEIQAYFRGVADKYRLQRFIKFSHRVISALWDDKRSKYDLKIEKADGTIVFDECHILLNACGLLNGWKWPKIPGLHDFQGTLLHTAKFDRSWTPNDRSVALIGNGSSGIQVLPQIQPHAKRVDAYVRSPTWVSMPFAPSKNKQPGGNPLYTEEEKKRFAEDPEYHLQYRPVQVKTLKQLQISMREALAKKPGLISILIPTFGVGCRRITPGVGYLEALCENNVEVVTQDIARITQRGIVTPDGKERLVDTIICATGFDVSFTPRFELAGSNGYRCDERFGADPKGYLTLAIPDLKNYWIFYGSQACAANGSFLPVLEATGDYIIKCIQKMQTEDILAMTPKQAAVDDLVRHADCFHQDTVWSHGCRSWYKNNTIDGRVAAVWPGSTLHYLETIKNPRWEDYEYTYAEGLCRFSYLGNGTTLDELAGAERAYHIRSRANLFDAWWEEHVKTLDMADAVTA